MVVSWDESVRQNNEREPLNEDGESAICGSRPKMTSLCYKNMPNILNSYVMTCFLEKHVDCYCCPVQLLTVKMVLVCINIFGHM
jgi:hypothetical protein